MDLNAAETDEGPAAHSYSEQAARAMVYYAAERTLMAWLRAALGMMALGFVIDRLSLVLSTVTAKDAAISQSYSFWSGSALVFGGVAMAIVAALRYGGIAARYRREGVAAPGHGLPLGIAATVAVAVIGLVIGVFLVVARP